jgi:hypothetical protein
LIFEWPWLCGRKEDHPPSPQCGRQWAEVRVHEPIAESQANPPNAARRTDVLTEPRLQNEKQACKQPPQDFYHPKTPSDFGFNLEKTSSIEDTVFLKELDDSLRIFA